MTSSHGAMDNLKLLDEIEMSMSKGQQSRWRLGHNHNSPNRLLMSLHSCFVRAVDFPG